MLFYILLLSSLLPSHLRFPLRTPFVILIIKIKIMTVKHGNNNYPTSIFRREKIRLVSILAFSLSPFLFCTCYLLLSVTHYSVFIITHPPCLSLYLFMNASHKVCSFIYASRLGFPQPRDRFGSQLGRNSAINASRTLTRAYVHVRVVGRIYICVYISEDVYLHRYTYVYTYLKTHICIDKYMCIRI